MQEVVQTEEITKEVKAPKQYTRREVGQLRRRYLTVHLPSVVVCGHKFRQERQPNNNCFSCWQTYFKLGANIQELHAALAAKGHKGLAETYGDKFVKFFGMYLQEELKVDLNVPVEAHDTTGE